MWKLIEKIRQRYSDWSYGRYYRKATAASLREQMNSDLYWSRQR